MLLFPHIQGCSPERLFHLHQRPVRIFNAEVRKVENVPISLIKTEKLIKYYYYYLSLTGLKRGDGGNYTCVAENLVGAGESNPLEIRVKCEFIFIV